MMTASIAQLTSPFYGIVDVEIAVAATNTAYVPRNLVLRAQCCDMLCPHKQALLYMFPAGQTAALAFQRF